MHLQNKMLQSRIISKRMHAACRIPPASAPALRSNVSRSLAFKATSQSLTDQNASNLPIDRYIENGITTTLGEETVDAIPSRGQTVCCAAYVEVMGMQRVLAIDLKT